MWVEQCCKKKQVLDVTNANKVLQRVKSSHMRLHYKLIKIHNASVVIYNYSSYGKIKMEDS